MSSLSDDEELISKLDNIDLKTTLNEDIAILDTEEFHLPSVDALPTLESILGEDDQGNSASPINSRSAAKRPTDTVSESGSVDSLGGEVAPTHLRHSPLLGIASQLQSAAERVGAGAPTALTAGSVIVVGTSHGLCLVFEMHEAMRYCLGDSRTGQQLGAVSCLHLSPDSSRLLAGYARGQIQLYDVTQGKLLMTVNEASLRSTAIIHLRFTDVPDVALFSDSGGSVFEVRLRRSLARRSAAARCLFSGSRGEVVTVEPLPAADHPAHPLQAQMIVAMATMSKVIVVSVRPQLRVLFTHPLEAGPLHVPLIDWQFVVIRVGSGQNMVDPVLTFARKSTVFFYQVCCPSEQTKFVPLQWVEFPFVIQNLKWMNSRTMALIDTHEKLHLWDVRGQQQLETLDLSFVKMVYSTSYFKGLATGGNVSKAMAVAGEKACFESCLVSGGQLMLLGTRGVHVLTLRTWLERLEAHVRAGEFGAALRLAWSLYGERSTPLAGLQGSSGRRQAIIKERMLSLVDEWLDFCLRSPSSDQLLSQAVPTCVQYLLDLDESAMLFGRVASLLESDPAGGALLLDALPPHITSGRLTAPPPLTMQQLVTHLERQDRLQMLEECLVRVDIPSLDINQVLPLCWRRGLYDVIVRIHTVGMGDYISPLLEMLASLASLLADGAPLMDGQAQLGNKLLVYVSSCLAGRGYPSGHIPAARVHEVKLGVLSALTAVHSKNAADAERPYPHLRTLLTFDTREFLNVLSLSFEEDVFCSELGMRQRQRIVDILLTLMVDRDEYSPSQLGSLFTFIARQMALPKSTVSVSRDLFDKVVDHLTVPGDTAHHEERQQALAELISTGVLKHYDTQRLAQLAEAAKFYRICELLFEERGEHERTAGCMLRHGGGRAALHRFVAQRAAAERTAAVSPPRDAASIALLHLQELLDIDLNQTAALFTSCLCRHLEEAVLRLDSAPEQRYHFLGAIIQQSSSVVLPGSVYGQYLALMCQLEPDRVPQFISEQDTFDHDQYLEICRSAGHREGEAHLLERSGDTAGALQTLLDGLDETQQQASCGRLVSQLTAAVRLCQRSAGRLPDAERRRCWFALLERAVAFQQRTADSGDDAEAAASLVPLVVGSMIGHVPLPEVMRRLLREPAYSGGQLGHLRPLLTDLLRTCDYERVLYDSARRITQADTRDSHEQKRRVWSRGYGAPSRCHVCGRRPDLQRGQMLAFRCGHFCHPACAPPPPEGTEGSGAGRACGLCRGRGAPLPLGRAAGPAEQSAAAPPTVAPGIGPASHGPRLEDMLQTNR